jgi:hypothetical protein
MNFSGLQTGVRWVYILFEGAAQSAILVNTYEVIYERALRSSSL